MAVARIIRRGIELGALLGLAIIAVGVGADMVTASLGMGRWQVPVALPAPDSIRGAVAGTAALTVATLILLRVEMDLPYAVGLLVVPVVVGAAVGLAVALAVWLAIPMLHALAAVAALVVGLMGVTDVLQRLTGSPGPPSVRY